MLFGKNSGEIDINSPNFVWDQHFIPEISGSPLHNASYLWFGLLIYLWCPVMRKLMFAAKVWWGQNQEQSICRTLRSATLSDWICTENKGCQQTFPASISESFKWLLPNQESDKSNPMMLQSCDPIYYSDSPGRYVMPWKWNVTIQSPGATEHHLSQPELSRLLRPASCSSSAL